MSDDNNPVAFQVATKELVQSVSKLHDVTQMLEDKTKYTSLLELFNEAKLKLITRLDKANVDNMTKFETLAWSQKLLFGLTDEDDGIKIINVMANAYRANRISLNGKSRAEVVEVLKDASQDQQQRDAIRRLTGAR